MPVMTTATGDARDVLRSFPPNHFHCAVTSPPYWQHRDYNIPPTTWSDGECSVLGAEPDHYSYLRHLAEVLDQVHRVLRDDGTLWLNLGDCYCKKRPLMIPHLAGALLSRGSSPCTPDSWLLRQVIVWNKTDANMQYARDRCALSHEYILLFTKRPKGYYFDRDALPHYARGSVWSFATENLKAPHFAVFPQKLPEAAILAGTSEYGVCTLCGAPYIRITERARTPTRPARSSKTFGKTEREFGNRDPLRHTTTVQTVGWEATCGCDTAPYPDDIGGDGQTRFSAVTPCRVLDPFAGACTTGLVAHRLGRDSCMIDTNPSYLKMGQYRLEQERSEKQSLV